MQNLRSIETATGIIGKCDIEKHARKRGDFSNSGGDRKMKFGISLIVFFSAMGGLES